MAVLKKTALSVWLPVRALTLTLALGWALWALAATRTWQDVEIKGFDWLTIASAPGRSELPIVLVGIDDASLAELQQRWPWPRDIHARLIEALSTAGAAVIAFDVLFEFPSVPAEDADLAHAIARAGNVVLAAGLVQQETSHGTAWMRKEPLAPLRDAASGTGLVNLLYDRDQALRRIPYNDDAFWRIVVARLRQQLPEASFAHPPPEGALIRYNGPPGTYPRISFYQALEPQRYLPVGELAGALVIVGRDTRAAADIGAAQVDTFATPFTQAGHPHMVGMEIHANVFENVLSGGAIRPVPANISAALAAWCVLLAALSFAIGKGAFAAVAAWYGKQGGVDFRANVSMLARLAMGMQESPVAAGWYNKYIEQFFAADVTAQQEKAQAIAAIDARLGWMRENPAAALAFYREKLLTQWLDPAYDSLWMGELSEKVGRYNGLIGSIYRRKDGLRTLMDGYMDAMQTAVYALSALGGTRLLKKRDNMAALALPVTILGGALYHLIFEAKAQYAYPYMVYMLPLAAAGLCTLAEKLKKISG